MLDSAQKVFNSFLPNVGRYDVVSIEVRRGSNPEDLFYLCQVKNNRYIVLETDYVSSPDGVTHEIAKAFYDYGVRPLYWRVVFAKQKEAGAAAISAKKPIDEAFWRQAFIVKARDHYLRYALLEVDLASPIKKRYNPLSYGSFS